MPFHSSLHLDSDIVLNFGTIRYLGFVGEVGLRMFFKVIFDMRHQIITWFSLQQLIPMKFIFIVMSQYTMLQSKQIKIGYEILLKIKEFGVERSKIKYYKNMQPVLQRTTSGHAQSKNHWMFGVFRHISAENVIKVKIK